VKDPVKLPHSYHPTGYYVRTKWVGEDTANIEYELQEEDFPLLTELKKYGVVDASLIEWLITVWEKDTDKGQEIPFSLSESLVKGKDKLLTVSHPTELLEKVYEHWIYRRKKLKHALIRKYWRSEHCEDKNLKLVFRPYTQERMKTRNSRKNDKESLHQMRQLKNNLDELYDLLISVQMRENLKKFQLDVEAALFEQQVEELKSPNFSSPKSEPLLRNEILEQSAIRRKSSKLYEDTSVKKSRTIIPLVDYPKTKADKPKPTIIKKSKIEIGPELAIAACSILVQGIGVATEPLYLPLKRTISMREEEQDDTADSHFTDEAEEPRILARRRSVRGLKALALERYYPGTFRNEACENLDATFSEDEEIDERYCRNLGINFKQFLRERRVVIH